MENQPQLTQKEALAAGYCITSRECRLACRIDRPDWKNIMVGKDRSRKKWLQQLGPNNAADYYRRVHSKDEIIVPESWIETLPSSLDGSTDFLPLPETPKESDAS